MIEVVRRTILDYDMISPGEQVVIGVSGGPDSIALLHCLKRLSTELKFGIFVVHINHGVRPESEEEAEFVKRFAAGLEVPIVVRRINGKALKQGSFQELARDARRQIFTEVSNDVGAAKIALGHNANDQAETVLQRLLRGGGTTGLGGIHPKRDRIIRPLLFVQRYEIEQYLQEQGLEYRTDLSNFKPVYLRNKIRLELLPLLEREYNPRLVNILGKSARVLQEEDAFLEELAEHEFLTSVSKIDGSYLVSLSMFSRPLPIAKRVVRKVCAKLTMDPRGLEYDHVSRIIEFARIGYSGGFLELPNGVKVYKEQQALLFSPCKLIWPEILERVLQIPGETTISELGITIVARIVDNPGSSPLPEGLWSLLLDYELLKLPLIIRGRKPGDIIMLKGRNRKLKEVFTEKKIPVRLRESSAVLVQEEEVIWIPGLLRSDSAHVMVQTRKVLELAALKTSLL